MDEVGFVQRAVNGERWRYGARLQSKPPGRERQAVHLSAHVLQQLTAIDVQVLGKQGGAERDERIVVLYHGQRLQEESLEAKEKFSPHHARKFCECFALCW